MASNEGSVLPLDLQRLVLIAALDSFLLPSSNHQRDLLPSYRQRSRFLAQASLVNREWKDIAYPYLYRTISLSSSPQLSLFTQTILASPSLGLNTLYLFSNPTSTLPPPRFVALLANLPSLRHFHTSACVGKIEDSEGESGDGPLPKLWTLEIGAGWSSKDGEDSSNASDSEWEGRELGEKTSLGISRWADLSELRSLTLHSLSSDLDLFDQPLPNLNHLGILTEPFLPEFHRVYHLDVSILAILTLLGPQLTCLRLEDWSSWGQFLPPPPWILSVVPNVERLEVLAFGGDRFPLATLVKTNGDLDPSKLRTLVLGAPDVLDYSARSRRSSRDEEHEHEGGEEDPFAVSKPVSSLDSPTSSFWTTVEEEIVAHLQDLLHDVESLPEGKKTFPAMKEVVVWGLDFGNVGMRRSPGVKVVCEEMERELGWVVKDRFGERRDVRWEVEEEEGGAGDRFKTLEGGG